MVPVSSTLQRLTTTSGLQGSDEGFVELGPSLFIGPVGPGNVNVLGKGICLLLKVLFPANIFTYAGSLRGVLRHLNHSNRQQGPLPVRRA